jgi:hypothetical protein
MDIDIDWEIIICEYEFRPKFHKIMEDGKQTIYQNV